MATFFKKFFGRSKNSSANAAAMVALVEKKAAEVAAENAAKTTEKAAAAAKKEFWAQNAQIIKEEFISFFAEEFVGAEIAPAAKRGDRELPLKYGRWLERATQGRVYIGPTYYYPCEEAFLAGENPANYRPAKDIYRIGYQFGEHEFQGPDPGHLEEKIPACHYCRYGKAYNKEWREQLSPFLCTQEMNSLLATELRSRGFTVEMERGYLSKISW